jgi:hypothetical protein
VGLFIQVPRKNIAVTLPSDIRTQIVGLLWKQADAVNWSTLSQAKKAEYYAEWAIDAKIGGVLAGYMQTENIRVYIKDTLMKSYTREHSAEPEKWLQALGIEGATAITKTFIKPHGCLLADGRVIAWGKAAAWKMITTAAFERSYAAERTPYGIVLSAAVGKYFQAKTRTMVEDAAHRLGIPQVVWIER